MVDFQVATVITWNDYHSYSRPILLDCDHPLLPTIHLIGLWSRTTNPETATLDLETSSDPYGAFTLHELTNFPELISSEV